MPKFVFSYRLPTDHVPGDQQTMSAWAVWAARLADSLGDLGAVPCARQLGNCGEATKFAGHSVISAHDLDTALTLAAAAPSIGLGGGIELGALVELDVDRAAAPAAQRG